MKKEVLVINYHKIDSGNDIGVSGLESIYSVKKSEFESQINLLMKNAIPVVMINDILDGNITFPFSVAITIDDGNSSDYEIIYPFLRRNNIKATFFLLTHKRIYWPHIVEMISQGFEIGSHGVSHQDLTKMNDSTLLRELEDSKKHLEDNTNRSIDYFSFPFGRYNQRLISLGKKAGYKAMLTTDVRVNKPGDSPFVIHRWSIKKSTSLEEFEKVILNRNSLRAKICKSRIKKAFQKVLGSAASDQLNLFISKLQR